jgi:hypothetical protein
MLDATELNFFLHAIPSENSKISTNSSDDFMPLFVVSFSSLKSLIFTFYAEEIYAGCDGTEFFFLQCVPLRVQ